MTLRGPGDGHWPLMGSAAKRGRQPARGAARGMGALGFALALLSAGLASGKYRRSSVWRQPRTGTVHFLPQAPLGPASTVLNHYALEAERPRSRPFSSADAA